jgi:hypothetical protein
MTIEQQAMLKLEMDDALGLGDADTPQDAVDAVANT